MLLLSGIGFFLLFGKFFLPEASPQGLLVSERAKLVTALQLPHHIRHYAIPSYSPLIGKAAEQSGLWEKFTDLHDPESADFAEVSKSPRSELVGQTKCKFALRKPRNSIPTPPGAAGGGAGSELVYSPNPPYQDRYQHPDSGLANPR